MNMTTFRSIANVINHIPKLQFLSQPAPSTRFFSSKKDDKNKCKKMTSSIAKGKPVKPCIKIKGVGCSKRAREECTVRPVKKYCNRLQVPAASFSECVKDPRPWHRMEECPPTDTSKPPRHCIKINEGTSIDGCHPPPPLKLEPDCNPRNVGARLPNKPCDPCDAAQNKKFKKSK